VLENGCNILITGATGFIGGRLIEVLIKEFDININVLVRNYKNASRIARFPINFFAGNIMDYPSLLEYEIEK